MRHVALDPRFRRGSGAALLAAATFWSGCSDLPDTVSGPDLPTTQAAVTALQEFDLRPAIQAQEFNGARLMAIPGVVGHGVGMGTNAEPVVLVFTLQPGTSGIPDRLDGFATRTVASGMFVALTDETAKLRPAPLGMSIGHPAITAGTLGFKVKDLLGNAHILSNNHVMANSNDANIGDNILQPGPFDGGSDPADKIATLSDFVAIDFNGGDNLVDAAIASVVSSDVLSSTPVDEGYGQPSSSTVSAVPGMAVQKYGRTTEHTAGSVDGINATVDVCYETRGPFRCVKLARFVNQIIITPAIFSDGGDSGSGIVTDDGNLNPVGLLFAGSSSHTIANPIDAVLGSFNVTVDDGTGAPGNDPPMANDVAASGDEDAAEIPWTPDASDPNGDALTCSISSQPAGGTAAVSSDCSGGTYTPDVNFNGQDAFTYSASDGSAADQGTVTVTVNPVNDAPVANGDTYDATTGSTLDVTAPGVLGNDSDVDGDPLTAVLDAGPANASSFTLNEDGSFSYTSDTEGTDSFTYSASDGNLASGVVTVTINVSAPAPGVTVTGIDPNSASTNSTVEVTISGSGFAPGATVTFENGSGPAPGISNLVVVEATTITSTVTVKGGGPPRDRVWDVRVTNPDGSSGVLFGAFTITP